MYGSENRKEDSIKFGTQLIDTFKPLSILLEDEPFSERESPKMLSDKVEIPGTETVLTHYRD